MLPRQQPKTVSQMQESRAMINYCTENGVTSLLSNYGVVLYRKKKLNSAQIPNDLSPEGFTSLDDSVVATESALFDELPADRVINGDVVHLEMIARMIAQIQKYELKNEP